MHVLNVVLQGTVAQMCSVVSLFIDEVQRMMEEMITSMHQENFGRWEAGGRGGGGGGGSEEEWRIGRVRRRGGWGES